MQLYAVIVIFEKKIYMNIAINEDWKFVLEDEFSKPYFEDLIRFVDEAYKTSVCYPKQSEVFNAFNLCAFKDLKIVIIGQDPYHGKNQANGLCFSVNIGEKHPPSLINIFKELQSDIGIEYPTHGDLTAWAEQGILLLNTILTVKATEAGSHKNKGWEEFTDAVIKTISKEKENVIFLLWGGFAKRKAKLIDSSKHKIIECGHPSPLSANRGYWFGNRCFSETNSLLQQVQTKQIQWQLD